MSKKIRINIYDLALFLNEHTKRALRGDYNNPLLVEFIKQYNEKLQEVSFNGYDDVNNEWFFPTTKESIKAIRLMFNLSNTNNVVLLDKDILTPCGMDKVLESYKTKPANSIRKERRIMRARAESDVWSRKLRVITAVRRYSEIVTQMKKELNK